MALIEINISFQDYTSHEQLVNDLSPVFSATEEDTVYFRIDLNTYSKMLYGDFLILIVAAVKHLAAKNIQYNGHFANFDYEADQMHYASRINFFKELNIPYQEKFKRRSGLGKFIEITSYHDDTSAAALHKQIVEILQKSANVNKPVLMMLDYCLYEVLDNVLIHAKSPINGWCVTQVFSSRKEIRMMITDTGIGIHKALTEPENSKFKNLTEAEAIIKCTDQGVTNGLGMGNGLFHTSLFIKENGGELILHSGGYVFKIVGGKYYVAETPNWQGTYLFMRVNTTIDVDYKLIMGDTSTREDDFDFLFGEPGDLW